MPTLATMRIPAPTSWLEFQDITTSALKIRWSSPTLQQYGRQGQRQQGVDIFGPDHLGRPSGIQCKCQDSIDDKTIAAEIALAESFLPSLANYYFALAGPRDARVQQSLRLTSEARLRAGKFAVGIFFWDDLLEDLTGSPAEFKRHFPELHLGGEPVVDVHTQIFGAYDVAYHGIDIRHSIELIFGELGVMVDENPLQLDQLMRIIEASSQYLFSTPRHQELVLRSRRLVEEAMSARAGKGDWATVDGIAGSIEAQVRGLEYTLTGQPLIALDLGFAMRQWEHDSGEPKKEGVSSELREKLLARSQALQLPMEALDKLERCIDEYNAGRGSLVSSNIPWKAYNQVRRAIRALRFGQL